MDLPHQRNSDSYISSLADVLSIEYEKASESTEEKRNPLYISKRCFVDPMQILYPLTLGKE